jgi:hypothetical protein
LDNHVENYLIDESFNSDSFLTIQKIFKLGYGRLLKFILVRDSVLGFYVGDNLPEDLSLGILDIFKQVYQINYINLLMYKALFNNDGYKAIIKNANFLPVYVIWLNEGIRKAKNLKQVLTNCMFNWKPRLVRFLDRLILFYELVMNSFIIRHNSLIESQKAISLEATGKHKEMH